MTRDTRQHATGSTKTDMLKHKTMKLPNGTTLTGNGLSLVLNNSHCVPEPGSCAEDTWEYDWITPDGRSHITTDAELAGLLADGAKLGGVSE
jgi:hypothetical protein